MSMERERDQQTSSYLRFLLVGVAILSCMSVFFPQSLHTNRFLHKAQHLHTAFWTRLVNVWCIRACIDPTLLLSHVAPRHATTQLRLTSNDDDHLSSLKCVITGVFFLTLSLSCSGWHKLWWFQWQQKLRLSMKHSARLVALTYK